MFWILCIGDELIGYWLIFIRKYINMLLSSLATLIEEINEKALPFRIGKVD